jgi:membrane protein implicated in regulation of membrane protease activity
VFVVWIVAAVLLAIGEVLTPGAFFLGPVAVAAGIAAIVALIAGGVVSTIVFILAALLSLAVLRPIARRHVRMPQLMRTGTDALVGRRAVVTKRVDASGGRVRIGGEEWTARAYLEDGVYAEGATVDVVRIDGATALVAE